MSLLQMAGVQKKFFRKKVLEGVDLALEPGEILGLVGENGAGKTTTMNIILGLEHPEAGEALLFGEPCGKDIPERRLKIGFVSETVFTPSYFNVSRAIKFHSSFYPDWDDNYCSELMDRFSLDPEAGLYNMSRGELARLDLLLALSHRPPLLLLDEITAGLDALVRHELILHLRELVTDDDISIFFATNMLHDLEKLATRIAFLYKGKVIIDAPVDDILDLYVKLTFESKDGFGQFPDEVAVTRLSDHEGHHVVLKKEDYEGLKDRPEVAALSPRVSRTDLESAFVFLSREKRESE